MSKDTNKDICNITIKDFMLIIRTIVGLGFLAFGLFVFSIPDAAAPRNLVGLVFTSVGAIVVLARKGLTLNKSERTITQWWGMLGLNFKVIHNIEKARFISIEWHEWGDANNYSFLISIEIEKNKIELARLHYYKSACKYLKQIALFLELDTKNQMTKETVVRKASTLDLSLREKLQAENVLAEYPAAPKDLRLKINKNDYETEFILPAFGVSLASIAIGAHGAVFAVMSFLSFPVTDGVLPCIVAVIFSLPGWLLLRYAIISVKRRDIITVSPEEISLRRKGLLGENIKTIRSSDIKEVEFVMPDRGIKHTIRSVLLSVRSDDKILEFGHSLNEDELKYLRDLIQYILVS